MSQSVFPHVGVCVVFIVQNMEVPEMKKGNKIQTFKSKNLTEIFIYLNVLLLKRL